MGSRGKVATVHRAFVRRKQFLIGIISDTHGLMRPEALRALQGSDFIVHAGDIGNLEVVRALESIAPVIAIRGNNDRGKWAAEFPETKELEVGGVKIYVLHDLKEIAFDPYGSGFSAVVSGHSHRPSVCTNDGVCFINPGSAGPRRFRLPVSIGFLKVQRGGVNARIVELKS